MSQRAPDRWEDYQAGRAHRSCERHHARRLRPYVLDPALSEHRAGAFRRLRFDTRSGGGWPMAARDLARPCAVVQRPGQRLSHSDQRRQPCRADLRRRHDLRWSEVLETAPLPGRDDIGGLRVRTIASRIARPARGPANRSDGSTIPRSCSTSTWLLVPRRRSIGVSGRFTGFSAKPAGSSERPSSISWLNGSSLRLPQPAKPDRPAASIVSFGETGRPGA